MNNIQNNKRWTKAINFSAGTEEEMLATLPPSENENENGEDEMVRGRRTSSAPSDQVSFKSEKTAFQSDDNSEIFR